MEWNGCNANSSKNMKEYTSKDSSIDLDNMLYRYVKEMVSNHTTYCICDNDPIVRENEKGQSIFNEKCIGVVVIENNVLVKNKINYIIHCVVKGMVNVWWVRYS